MPRNNRIENREHRVLPVSIAGGLQGLTRDVSASGVYFETDSEQTVGTMVDFVIDFDTLGGPLHLKCSGQVIRTERRGARSGAAVKILESNFEAGRSDFGALPGIPRKRPATGRA